MEPERRNEETLSQNVTRLQALLPRPAVNTNLPTRPPPIVSPNITVPRRQATAVACEACRAKRTKCDGGRPKCGRCERVVINCHYDAGPDETRALARKRRYDEMKDEYNGLLDLYMYIQTRPLPDAVGVVQRIQRDKDPQAVLRLLRDGDLLLEATATARKFADDNKQATISRIDTAALRLSPIRVPARPWTEVATDGLVSELMSIFFVIEQPFIATFVDRKCFLEEIRTGKPGRDLDFCSSLLVNAICAYTAFTSNSANAMDRIRGGSTRELFFAEAKMILDLECGRPSAATAMALHIMFLYCSAAGMDRAGSLYRLYSCDMFRNIGIGRVIPRAKSRRHQQHPARYERGISRAAWGLFCAESIVSFIYIQQSLICIPTLPRKFSANRGEDESGPNRDKSACEDQYLDSECDLSILFYDIMSHNLKAHNKLGQKEDIDKRMELYERCERWQPPPFRGKYRGQLGLGQAIFLGAYAALTGVGIFRPLEGHDVDLPNGLGTPGRMTVRQCSVCMAHMNAFEEHFPLDWARGSMATLYFSYIASISLIGNLEKEPGGAPAFTSACRHFYVACQHYPVAAALLKGLESMALELGVELPPESRPYFRRARRTDGPGDDIPISYRVPDHQEIPTLLGHEHASDGETDQVGVELGAIIAKWS